MYYFELALSGVWVIYMKYTNVIEGHFRSRPNRFMANVEINGSVETVHVKNTGRCKELLIPEGRVFLQHFDSTTRKTKYDLIAVYKERQGKEPLLINMDSQAPNKAVAEWLAGGLFSKNALVRSEVPYKNSRFDFYVEDSGRKAFVEVKGVTLENNGIAAFPDAPTERGIKHLRELMQCMEDGFDAYVLFVVQMKEVHIMKPNDATHKAFGDALRDAIKAGVKAFAVDCIITPDEMKIDSFIDTKI